MGGGDTDYGLAPCLVDPRDLVEKYEGKLILFIGDLDHITVYRLDIRGNRHLYLVCCHLTPVMPEQS